MLNDDDGKYKNMQTENTLVDAMYIMKANQTLNSEMYSYCQSEISIKATKCPNCTSDI